jgi:ABC-type Co2+ transport system permease subunit
MLMAMVAAVLVLVQFFEFPVAGGGSTWHIMGGTFVTMILGPHGGIISMTITLVFQALVLGLVLSHLYYVPHILSN